MSEISYKRSSVGVIEKKIKTLAVRPSLVPLNENSVHVQPTRSRGNESEYSGAASAEEVLKQIPHVSIRLWRSRVYSPLNSPLFHALSIAPFVRR